MKKYFTLAFLLAGSMAFAQNNFEPRQVTGPQANAIWPGAELIWIKQQNTAPAFIEFRNGSEPTEAVFFAYLRKKFLLPANYTFNLLTDETDNIGWQHKRYQINVNGTPVNNGIFIVHLVNGKVKKYNGYLFNGIHVSTSPGLNQATALNDAIANIGAQQYKWQIPGEEEYIKRSTGDPSATFYPKGALEIVQVGGNTSNNFRLAWKFDIYAQQPLSRNYVYVDAQTGQVIKKISRLCNADATGTAVTAYRGNRTIHTDSYNGSYRLHDLIRGQGVYTYNLQRGTNYNSAVDFTDADNTWNNVNANKDQYAGDAHWGGEMTYDFYQSMGRNSIDNNGFRLLLYVHYDQNYLNAFWDGQRMTFGDGSTGYTPLTSLDITGHEISHGLDQHTANLDYQDESGGLNESFSDIFGTAVEWFADSTQGNWLIGEDIGTPFRSMSSPKTYQQPNTYHGQYWYTGTADYGGVHTNSGVQNHWYYRVAQGGSGTNDNGNTFNVTGIGRHKATQIAWRNMVYYLTNTSNYADARFYAIQSANDLFGTCSQESITTTNAWYAVGVGAAFSYGVSAQFTASPVSGCQVPLVVNFTNASTNANNYTWDFGDGTTATQQNPSHTYTTFGTYTVKLLADGGVCGADSIVAANLIDINASNPCEVVLPHSGTYQTQTSCSGTVYDDGGSAGNYSDMSSSTVTIAPTGASKVNLHFTQFGMENNYDYLYVYDGPTTASPVIGSYTGTTLPGNITSTGSSITIRQYSDQYVNDVGFTIQWSCVLPNAPPVADFKADVTQTCSGSVSFTDLSTGGASSWLWDFGDGTTSTQQSPAHAYATNGTFTVQLTATNSFGSNTKTRAAYITVNKPAAPAPVNGVSCGTGSVNLSVNSTDNVTWYDSTGNVVSTSNPFATPVLNHTTTYYAETDVQQSVYHAGAADNTIGGGGYFNASDRTLLFHVYKNCKLISVYVYATGSGYRTIQQRDSVGGVIQERTVYCADGGSRVLLNFSMAPGTYQLGLRDTMNLYRNSSGGAFPYNDADGMVSIYGNNAGGTATAYYYFFYDWELQENDCISLRSPVTAVISTPVTTSITPANVSCNGGSNGAATVAVTGGTPGFIYNWSNGQTTNPATNLAHGSYTLTVTDTVGCSHTDTVLITEPAALSVITAVTASSCNQANGTITTTTGGGTTPYSYNWSNSQTTPGLTGLAAGIYQLTVTDAHNCTHMVSDTVAGGGGGFNVTISKTDADCYGASSGSATVTPAGGTPTYTYLWSNSASVPSISNIAAGTYTVTVTDAVGCSTTSSISVSQPTQITAAFTTTDATCGQANGEITANASGGAGGYTYNWSNSQTGPTISNLTTGNYHLTVTDNSGCSATATQAVTNSGAFTVTQAATNVSCYGSTDGEASVNINGGTPGYNYAWNTGDSIADITGIAAGNYTVTITDGAGCISTASIAVNGPSQIVVATNSGNATCGQANGSVAATVSGGAGGYIYSWSNTATTDSIGGLASGTYNLTVTDANNCSASVSATISNQGSFIVFPASSDVACYGMNNGTASVSIAGGTPGYTYAWNNGGNTDSIVNIAAGNYTVTVTDALNCLVTASVTVNAPQPITLTINATEPGCYGYGNGSIAVTPSGGTANYSFTWNTGATSGNLGNLAAGNYAVTVTDANNCSTQMPVTLTQPNLLSIGDAITNISCNGDTSGAIILNVSGGTPGYTYSWDNGATTSVITGLTAGNYAVTVTDNHGCISTINADVQQPGALNASASATSSVTNQSNGTATVDSINGGVFPYNVLWSNGQSGATITGLAAGDYTATITDANGCTTQVTVTVTEVTGIGGITDNLQFSVYPNPASTQLTVSLSSLNQSTEISMRNVLGQMIFTKPVTGITTTLDVSDLAAGVYTIICKQSGETMVKQVVINR